jgi:hypothetical protein
MPAQLVTISIDTKTAQKSILNADFVGMVRILAD